jgi:glucokinase
MERTGGGGTDVDGARKVIALDVGGSSVKSGIVSDTHEVEDVLVTPVDSGGSAEEILAAFTGVIARHAGRIGGERPEGIAFGFPGPFDYAKGICLIRGLSKYEALYGLEIGTRCGALWGGTVPVRFRNDAEAAIVGEARYGAGGGVRRLIGVTLGTGMGSAFVEDGAVLDRGTPGIPADALLYREPFRGEQADEVFSARGLMRRLATTGRSFTDIESAYRSAAAGDPALRGAFEAFAADLCLFLEPYIDAFGAEAVLVAGGISGAFPLFATIFEARLRIPALPGTLGRTAALLGAADLFFANPASGS